MLYSEYKQIVMTGLISYNVLVLCCSHILYDELVPPNFAFRENSLSDCFLVPLIEKQERKSLPLLIVLCLAGLYSMSLLHIYGKPQTNSRIFQPD